MNVLVLLSVLTVALADAGGEGKVDAGSARITVRVPDGAALYVDNVRSPFATDTHSFSTPPLNPGVTYTYLLRVTTPTGVTQPSRRIYFRAGEIVKIDFRAGAPVVSLGCKPPPSKPQPQDETESPRPGGPAPQ